MALMREHEDLKPREVVGIDSNGRLLVLMGEEVRRYKLLVGANGTLKAEPLVDQAVSKNDVDQRGEREAVPVAARWIGVDQG